MHVSSNSCRLSDHYMTCQVRYSNSPGKRGALAGTSGRNGGRHATRRQQLSELSGFEHFADDVAAADELAFDVELRNRWPVRERFDPPAQRRIAEHVDTLELDAQMIEHLHHDAGKTALRENRRALHE